MAVAQSDESEIQILISKAPVTEAAAAADGEEILVVVHWIRALAYAGKVQEAYAAVQKLKEKMPDEDFVTIIPEGLSMAGKTEEVLAAVLKIKSNAPDTIMMTAMALARVGKTKEAVAEANKIKDVEDRGDVLALISKELAKAGKAEEATAVANQIKGEGGHSLNEALGKIAEALAKAGKSAEALATVRKIKEKMAREISLETVIEELAKAGKVNEALEALQEIGDEASRSQTLIAVVEAFTDSGRIDEANAIAHKIKDNFGLALSLGKVTEGLNKAGKKDEAQKTLNEALIAARSINTDLAHDKAIAYISICLAHAEMTSEAMIVIRECKDDNEQAWAYEEITEALAKQGNQDEAMKLARSINESYGQRYAAITKIIHRLNEAGKPGQNDIVKSAASFSSLEQAAVAQGLALAGKTEEAMAIARGIKDEGDRSVAFAGISQSLALSHLYRQARQAADLCPSPLTRLKAYFSILTNYAIEKNPDLKSRLEADDMNM